MEFCQSVKVGTLVAVVIGGLSPGRDVNEIPCSVNMFCIV